MSGYGFVCERIIRDILPEIDIPHWFSRNGHPEWFWWANRHEDRVLGVDCWIHFARYGEVAVDFTVISERSRELLQQKVARALGRGVVPVVLEQGMLIRAANGSWRALQEFSDEIHMQIPLKLRQLNGNRLTRTSNPSHRGNMAGRRW